MSLRDFTTPEKVIRYWKHAALLQVEFHFLILQTLTPENLDEFLRLVPSDDLEKLKTVVETAPTTDEEWGETISIRSWCGPWNNEIASRVREEEEQACRRYRVGIETLRSYLRKTKEIPKHT